MIRRLSDESRCRPARQAEQRPPARHPGSEADRPAASRTSAGSPKGGPCWSRCSRSASTPPTARSTRPSTATPRPGASISSSATRASAQVVEVGDKVTEVEPGDYVSCTVRRPGGSLFDMIGRNDITSEEVYYERGINLCHGYLTEYVRRRRRVHRQGAAEPQAPGRPVRAGQRLRQGDRAGVPGAAAAAGLGAEAGVRPGVRADRPARHDDAQAPRAWRSTRWPPSRARIASRRSSRPTGPPT